MASDAEQQLGRLVGARLREARKALNYTQGQLAGNDFSVSYISAIERGQIHPSLRALEIFAQKLGLPSKDILLGPTAVKNRSVLAAQEGNDEELTISLLIAEAMLAQGQVEQARQHLQSILSGRIPSSKKSYTYYLLAQAHLQLTEFSTGEHYISEAARHVGDPNSLLALKILNLQGIINTALYNHAQGLVYHQQCLEKLLSQPLQDASLLLEVYAHLGDHYLHLEQAEKAAQMLTCALELAQGFTPAQRAEEYRQLFAASNAISEKIQAEFIGYKSLLLLADLQSLEMHRQLHHMLGRAFLHTDGQQVQSYLEEALHETPADAQVHASAHIHLAAWQLSHQNIAEAKQHTRQALSLLSSTGDSIITADAAFVSGKIEYAQKRYKAGDAYIQAGIETLERLGARADLGEQLVTYSEMLEARGDSKGAIFYLKKALEISQKARP